MTLVLVPIPAQSVKGTAHVWLPFVQKIAGRTRQHVNDLVAQIVANEVQLHLVWDPDTRTAHALAGTRILRRGHDHRHRCPGRPWSADAPGNIPTSHACRAP